MYGSYWLRSVVLALAYFHFAKAHMRMSSPPPIRSPEEGVNVDFDQTSPLGVYPCKGFHTLPGHSSVMNIAAGSTIPVTYFSWPPHVLMQNYWRRISRWRIMSILVILRPRADIQSRTFCHWRMSFATKLQCPY